MEPVPQLALVADAPLSRTVAQSTEAMLEGLERVARRVDEQTWLALTHSISVLADEAEGVEVPEELAGLMMTRLTTPERLSAVIAGVTRDFDRRGEIVAGALATAQAAKRLGLSRQGPHDRRADHRLLGVPHNNDWLFPAWQFDGRTRTGVLRGLPQVLEALSPLQEWDRAFWLTTPMGELDGHTPLEALRAGRNDQVELLARATAHQ